MKMILMLAVVLSTSCAEGPSGVRPPVPVPNGLQVASRMIEDAELILQERAGVRPAPDGTRQAQTLNRYIGDEVDPSRPETRARMKRLVRASDGKGLFCFYALGAIPIAKMFAEMASGYEMKTLANTMLGTAMHLQQMYDAECGGPGGKAAFQEWDSLGAAWAKEVDPKLHRAACQPAPFPGVVACAPTREEVYVPKSGVEWMMLCAGVASGFAAPAAVTAAGITWADLLAAGSVAVPAATRMVTP